MAVTVSLNPADFGLQVMRPPTVAAPAVRGNQMFFDSTPMRLEGFATLQGGVGEAALDWKVGFIQAQWVETNWCSYRGAANTDGSIFIQRGRPPARTQGACRDCVDGSSMASVFYSTNPLHREVAQGAAGDRFPLVLRVNHSDQPTDSCPFTIRNTLTGKDNFLQEAQFEFLFCTTLSVQDPAGQFTHLLGVYWNTRWHYSFSQPGNRAQVNPQGTGATIGHPFRVGAIDPRFAPVFTSPAQVQSCNAIFRAAMAAFQPGARNRHESRIWSNFNVTVP